MGEDFPTLRTAAAADALGVDRDHDALLAELLGCLLDEFASGDRGAVDRDLVGPRAQQRPDVVDGAHPAADRQRHEAGLSGPSYHVQHDAAIFVGGGNVEEAEFVGAGGVIRDRRFHGIAGVAQVDEVDALDHPSVLDVEAGDHTDLEHLLCCRFEGARFKKIPEYAQHSSLVFGRSDVYDEKQTGAAKSQKPSRQIRYRKIAFQKADMTIESVHFRPGIERVDIAPQIDLRTAPIIKNQKKSLHSFSPMSGRDFDVSIRATWFAMLTISV